MYGNQYDPGFAAAVQQLRAEINRSAGGLRKYTDEQMAKFIGRLDELSRITSAMTYPLLMLAMSTVVLGVLLVYVMPTIAKLLEDMDQDLPQ